jgi:hypothetical protein
MRDLMALLLGSFSRSVFIDFDSGTFIRDANDLFITAYTVDGFTFISTHPNGISGNNAALADLSRDKRISSSDKVLWKITKNNGGLFNLTSIAAYLSLIPGNTNASLIFEGIKSDNSQVLVTHPGAQQTLPMGALSNLTQLKSLDLRLDGIIQIESITFEDLPSPLMRYIPGSFVVIAIIFGYFLSRR